METKQKTKVECKYDVAVIGGGPAGTSSAYHAAKLGLKTVLLEKQSYPHQKPCGGALSHRCLPLLGERALAAMNCNIDALHLFSPAYHSFIHPSTGSHFILREEFDAAMAKDAAEAGARVVNQCRVKHVTLLPSGEYEIITTGETFWATHIIQATGFPKNAFNRPLIQREDFEEDYLAMTVVSETPIDNAILAGLSHPGYSAGIYFGAVPNGYGWCFIKKGYINIGIGASAYLIRDAGAVKYYHQFVAHLKKRGLLPQHLQLAKERTFPLPFKRTAKQTVFGNVLLVGDIAGFVSPVSGEGLYYAIKAGQLAATAIEKNLHQGLPLTTYQDEWMNDFGHDLNTYGLWLQKNLYKKKWRQEFIISLARRDPELAERLYLIVFGHTTYKQGTHTIIKRLPMAMLKSLF